MAGVCVARLALETLDGDKVKPHVSTGRPRVGKDSLAPVDPGFFVVDPSSDGGPAVLRLAPHGVGVGVDPLPGRRAKVRHPVRAARAGLLDWHASTRGPAAVEVVDLGGETVLEVETPQGDDGTHEVSVPGGVGPVFVRARKLRGGGAPIPVDWTVRVRSARG